MIAQNFESHGHEVQKKKKLISLNITTSIPGSIIRSSELLGSFNSGMISSSSVFNQNGTGVLGRESTPDLTFSPSSSHSTSLSTKLSESSVR